jgi:hypothetical protein
LTFYSGKRCGYAVIHVKVVANRPHDYFAGVHTDSNLQRDAVMFAQFDRILGNGVVHEQGCGQSALGMILQGQRSAKECHDAVS